MKEFKEAYQAYDLEVQKIDGYKKLEETQLEAWNKTFTPLEDMPAGQEKTKEHIALEKTQEKLAAARKDVVTKKSELINETVKLAESLGYKSDNPGLEPTQKELAKMGELIAKSDLVQKTTPKELNFLNNLGKEGAKTADLSLADPAKLPEEKITEIDTLLEKNDIYNAAQLMQGKEIDEDKSPSKKELEQANKVMREFQKAIDNVAPPVKVMGEKHKQHDNLRKVAKNIGTNLRQNFGIKNIKEIAQSMARTVRNALSSKTSITAASMVRVPKKEADKGQIR